MHMVVDMFDNPLAQEKDYRHYTIHSLPSVAILDRKGMFLARLKCC